MEHLRKANEERERILAESRQRLRLREEREAQAAKGDAEQRYRQRVQVAELGLQAELDRLRWTLVRSVIDQAWSRLLDLAGDRQAYRNVLARWLREGCEALGDTELVAELCARDREHLAGDWERFAAEAVPGMKVALALAPCSASGGLMVRDAANRVRVDNTFEGRRERLEEALERETLMQLFATVPELGAAARA